MKQCEQCGGPLSVFQKEPPAAYGGEDALRWWMVAVAIIWPIVGIIGGLLLNARGTMPEAG